MGADTAKILWCAEVGLEDKDTYVAFRGRFDLAQDAEIEFRNLGASWYMLWIDGEYLGEGPPRFPIAHPEYQAHRVHLAAGSHVIAAQVHYVGMRTNTVTDVQPFLFCEAYAGNTALPIAWRCTRILGYEQRVHRIGSCHGWIEWCDTRQFPAGWRECAFDDSAWSEPTSPETKLGPITAMNGVPPRQIVHALTPIAQGAAAEFFGYERDDPPTRFFLRDLVCDKLPAMGVWRRYDLGRVRLGRPKFLLDLPAGAIVEFAYSEYLLHDRVTPYINLGEDSCNFDHYVARGGVQEFGPITPKGGRFMEIHVLAPGPIRFLKEEYIERCYFGQPEGSFACEDDLLNRIWMTGVRTLRACSEDALTDCPTRERGQWIGDGATVGMEIMSSAFSDLRLCRRMLVQAAQCARADGMVAGLCPTGCGYLPTYSAQWIGACVHYYELTGDRALLDELYPAAIRNVAAYGSHICEDGLHKGLGWEFVDWHYAPGECPVDLPYNIHFLNGLRATIRWCVLLGNRDEAATHQALHNRLEATIRAHIQNGLRTEKGWVALGYHASVLALGAGLIDPPRVDDCIAYAKAHMRDCFPNNPDAPRVSDPTHTDPRVITPYFAHYALPPLIERGEMDFILDQYRTCWGWALEDGRTTWVEVFDTRWSHSHQWSGSPTWQLSRYVLGLHPRCDLGIDHYMLNLHPGSLPSAEGTIPYPGDGGLIAIEWSRQADGIHYVITPARPIRLHGLPNTSSPTMIESEFRTLLPLLP